jgi:2,4-dienoyl-CoA reductase-like NADH-dependent reductase (Old Yellow Enzyme family)
MDKQETPVLFQPVKFASVTSRNRIVMAPMVTNFSNLDEEVTDRQIRYYAERARGGAGTIVVEASNIHPNIRISARQIGSYDDRFIPGLSKLASAIKSHGTVALLQLLHGGPKVLPDMACESASSVSVRVGQVPRQLSLSDLRRIRQAYVRAASRAKKAGFDGVEIHAAHLYLLSAFLSPFTNQRTDEYGGSLPNRARLLREVIEEIKAGLGNGWPTWVRMNACELLQPGLSLEEGQEAAKIMMEAGADAIHVSAYVLPINKNITGIVNIRVGAIPLKGSPPGPLLPYAEAIKKSVHVPIIAVGKLDDPKVALKAIVDGKCDMTALGRQLICDPYWPSKLEKGQGKEIVHCNYCNTCHTAQQRGEEIICSQNLNLVGEPVYKKTLVNKTEE